MPFLRWERPLIQKCQFLTLSYDLLIVISAFRESFFRHIATKRSKNYIFDKNTSLVAENKNKIPFSIFWELLQIRNFEFHRYSKNRWNDHFLEEKKKYYGFLSIKNYRYLWKFTKIFAHTEAKCNSDTHKLYVCSFHETIVFENNGAWVIYLSKKNMSDERVHQ